MTFWQPKKVTCPTQNNGAMNCQKFFRTLSFLRGSEAYCKAHPQEEHCSKNCRFVIPDLSQGTSLARLLPQNHRKWIQYQKVLYNSNAQADCTADVWSHLISSHHISMVCFSPDVLLSQPQRIGSIIRSNPATNARTRA